jgi:hypothetical protein
MAVGLAGTDHGPLAGTDNNNSAHRRFLSNLLTLTQIKDLLPDVPVSYPSVMDANKLSAQRAGRWSEAFRTPLEDPTSATAPL